MHNEILCDILEYIGKQECHGKEIAVCITTNVMDYDYHIQLVTEDNFTQEYSLNRFDLLRIDYIRTKVIDIVTDFRDKYEKMVLKANNETDNLYPRLLTIPEYCEAEKKLNSN